MIHFLADSAAALLGGALLTLAIFWLGERVFPLPMLSGRWFVQTRTESTARQTYSGMLLKREIFIWQEGAALRGTSEKIYEDSSTGRRQYENVNRSRGTISGVANRYIFSVNRVRLHLEEKSGERVSTSYFDLVWRKESLFKRLVGKEHRLRNAQGLIEESAFGIFQSTAASSSGKTIWCRNRYDSLFEEHVRDEISDVYGEIGRLDAEAGLDEPS